MKMSDFTPEDQAEIAKAVLEASADDGGGTPSVEEARERFDGFLVDAIQAHRGWAAVLLDGFRVDGERAFIKHVQKSEAFRFQHEGKQRKRSLRRGTRRQDDEGKRTWVQDSLLSFTAAQLDQAIRECTNRIDEERANIAMYRGLIGLLNQTSAMFVGDALAQVGKSLEEFLSEDKAS